MTRRPRGLSPVSGAVDGFFQSQELAAALRPHFAKARWADVVGPQVAAVTWVEAVRDGVLFVRVKNSVWANELTLLKDDMVRRLNADLGGRVLTDIHFKASGLPRQKKVIQKIEDAPDSGELARIVLSEEARARVDTALKGIFDEELRERIRQTLLRAARTQAWKHEHGWPPCTRCGTLTAPDPSSPFCPLCRAGIAP